MLKGLIMAGGTGSRLYPMTQFVSKQLLPVYDKPMIYYPLTTLMQVGIREIGIITTAHDKPHFQTLLGDGQQWGIEITYITQPSADGIAQAFILAESFIDQNPVCLILGDNIFYGESFVNAVQQRVQYHDRHLGGSVFCYYVSEPERYGVVTLDAMNRPVQIVEKPAAPESHYAVTGIYVYDYKVSDLAKNLTPSQRGELEITDINNLYLANNSLHATLLGRGTAWLDTGTPASLLDAAQFVETLEKRQGLKVACPEEIAWEKRYIDAGQLEVLIKQIKSGEYREYLSRLLG